MNKQLKELNTNIKSKNRAIKRNFKNLPKVKIVYIVAVIFNQDEHDFQEFLSYEDADKFYNRICNGMEEFTYLSMNIVQRGGYMGGIILGTTIEPIKKIIKE